MDRDSLAFPSSNSRNFSPVWTAAERDDQLRFFLRPLHILGEIENVGGPDRPLIPLLGRGTRPAPRRAKRGQQSPGRSEIDPVSLVAPLGADRQSIREFETVAPPVLQDGGLQFVRAHGSPPTAVEYVVATA